MLMGSLRVQNKQTTILGLFQTLLITTFCLVHHTTCLSGQYSPAMRTRKNPGSRVAKILPGAGDFTTFLNGEIFPAEFSLPESPPPVFWTARMRWPKEVSMWPQNPPLQAKKTEGRPQSTPGDGDRFTVAFWQRHSLQTSVGGGCMQGTL